MKELYSVDMVGESGKKYTSHVRAYSAPEARALAMMYWDEGNPNDRLKSARCEEHLRPLDETEAMICYANTRSKSWL